VRLTRIAIRFTVFAAALSFSAAAGAAAVTRPASSVKKVFVYTDRHGRWCAVADYRSYDRQASAENVAREIDQDFGTVKYVAGIPTTVSRAQTDNDGEWWTEGTYSLDRSGKVIAAELYEDSTEGEERVTWRRRYKYAVRGGVYVPLSAEARKAAKDLFKAQSLASFPFASLLKPALRSPTHKTFCG